MFIHFPSLFGSNQFYYILNPLRNRNQKTNLFQILNLTRVVEMVTRSTLPAKRPMCSTCFKPARICLCTRFKTPILDNSVAVTILQHSLEKKHPLNSTRIAKLGLKNLSVVPVSDVNFEARFLIHLLKPHTDLGLLDSVRFPAKDGGYKSESVNAVNLEMGGLLEYPQEKNAIFTNSSVNGDQLRVEDADSLQNIESLVSECSTSEVIQECCLSAVENSVKKTVDGTISGGSKEPAITCETAKDGVIRSLTHQFGPPKRRQKLTFDHLLSSQEAVNELGKGFVVSKLQRKSMNGSSTEYEECEEFEVAVPPGSVLLFPSERSVGVKAINFEINNLIVLDGTWAKANRMYHENPWLKLLPHLKLDMDKLSLYSEVRHQPTAGCLSTIESIVYALKAIGGGPDGLDGLLDVFESMIGDQRRCKDARLNKAALE